MSELENAIKRLKDNCDSKELPYIIVDILKNNLDKETLNLLIEKLDINNDSSFSEALECLKSVELTLKENGFLNKGAWLVYDIGTIKQALLKAQTQEKVLEIKRESSIKAQEILGDYAILKKQYNKVVDELLEKQRVLDDYKDLEEEVGCPLEVVRQLFEQDFIYFKYPANIQIMKVKVCKGLSYGTNLGWHVTCIYDNIDFKYISLQDYKKTWWLKEDKSE